MGDEEIQDRRLKRLGIGAGAALGAAVVLAPAAQADTFVVDSLEDSTDGELCDPGSDCTLREAAIDASAFSAGDDVITFAAGLSGEINLQGSVPLGYDGGVEIRGPGADVLTIDGQAEDRIFKIAGFLAPQEQVLISGLTLSGGQSADIGGAVWNYGYIDPGDFYAYAADVTVSDSVIVGNSAEFAGGGVFNGPTYVDGGDPFPGGDLTIRRSTVTANEAGYDGGGVFNYYSDLLIEGSTLSANAVGGIGGAVFHYVGDDVAITSSTVSGNTANFIGGVANNHGEGLALRNTIVANSTATLEARSDRNGWQRGGVGTATPTQDIGTNDGSFAGEFSLVEDPSDYAISPLSPGPILTGLDPQLGPLASNGGPTQTHLPANTSPVLDQGSALGLATDQRGLARTGDLGAIANAPGGDGTDIGSVEVQTADCQGQGSLRLDGSPGDDTLTGTDGPDAIAGAAGNDTADGGGANDCVNGDEGNDRLKGGSGKDRLNGGSGKDKLAGNGGKDKLKGGAGKDKLKGGGGKDKLSGQGGKDTLKGGGGKDRLKGGPGKDKLVGGGGKDRFNCGGGKDKVTAQAKDKVSRNCEKVVEKG